jgi:hypothetical protein
LFIQRKRRREGESGDAAVEQVAPDELVIAVYLDTNVLLDLLATVEGGFSLVERVTSGHMRDTSSDRSASAEFGAPGVLNFFKLGISGRLGRTATTGTTDTRESDVAHTYGSLLHRLRKYLLTQGLVHGLGDVLTPGQFVEFSGVVRPNPFTASFRQLQRMIKVIELAVPMASQGTAAQTAGPHGQRAQGQRGQGQRGGQASNVADQQSAQMRAISDFLGQVTEDIEGEGTSTVLVESQRSSDRAVITLYDGYLRDRSMAELLNREFRVLGKVARHLPEGPASASISPRSPGLAPFLQASLRSSLGQSKRCPRPVRRYLCPRPLWILPFLRSSR